jgi:hypothetical protein
MIELMQSGLCNSSSLNGRYASIIYLCPFNFHAELQAGLIYALRQKIFFAIPCPWIKKF